MNTFDPTKPQSEWTTQDRVQDTYRHLGMDEQGRLPNTDPGWSPFWTLALMGMAADALRSRREASGEPVDAVPAQGRVIRPEIAARPQEAPLTWVDWLGGVMVIGFVIAVIWGVAALIS